MGVPLARPVPHRSPTGSWTRRAAGALACALGSVASSAAAPARAPRVVGVEFEGARAFAPARLQRFLETRPTRLWYRHRWDPATFERDLENLLLFYQGEGFLQACVWAGRPAWSADSSAVRPSVRIHEGRRWWVGSVRMRGAAALPPSALLAGTSLRAGAPYRSLALAADRRGILEALAERAYLDARLGQQVSAERDSVHIVYEVALGAPARFGRIELEGLRRTRAHVVVRELDFDSNAPFTSASVAASHAHLLDTGLFQSVDIAPVPGQEGRPVKDVRVRVVEKPAGDARLGAGYGAVEGARLRLQLRQLNLRGSGRQLGLDFRLSERRHLVELSGTEPWLLGARLSLDALSAYEWLREPRFTVESMRGALALHRHLHDGWSVDAGYQLRSTRLLRVPVQEARAARAHRTGKVAAGLARETRDDLFETRRGGFVRLELGIASPRFGGSQSFLSAGVVARRVVGIGTRLHVAAALHHTGIWLQESGRELPLEERLYAGGDGSVRGFERHALGPRDATGQALGGNHLDEVSLELRGRVERRVDAVLFADAGQLVRRARSLRLDHYAVGGGFGVRVRTPFGQLRSDIAWPLQGDSAEGAQLYFGVGQSF